MRASLVRTPARVPARARRTRARPPRAQDGAGFGEKLINGLTVALKNSPLNAGKKALAIQQGGGQAAAEAYLPKVDALIAEHPVMVFSWSGCPFCKRAKAILDDAGATYKVLELDQMEDGQTYRAALAIKTQRTSMPNVWIKGEGVGGCNDGPGVATLANEGKLVPMLKAAGAV